MTHEQARADGGGMATPGAALAASRDDKLARFHLAFVYLPAILMWL
jgi:hypothetical protein